MMLCPNCNQEVHHGAAFCGNCGFKLAGAHLKQAAQAPPTTQAKASQRNDNSGKAIAAFILGVLGLAGWIIPIIGVVLGILAIVLGSMSLKSRHRILAIIGMVLAVLVIAVSLFFWIRAAQHVIKNNDSDLTGLTTNSVTSTLQPVSTPCYTAKIPASMTITQTPGSCTFSASSNGESYEVKVLQVAQLTPANLAQAAETDANNVVNSTPGGSMSSQGSITFSGSLAYYATVISTDGSAGTIDYIYKDTGQGNLVIILHTSRSGKNYDLNSIENSWVWQ